MEIITKEVAYATKFYKKNETDLVWWIDGGNIGEHLFTFDKKKIYNLFADFPWKLSQKECAIFVKENPFWAEFFKDRLQKGG
jgi:hypothetical protein